MLAGTCTLCSMLGKQTCIVEPSALIKSNTCLASTKQRTSLALVPPLPSPLHGNIQRTPRLRCNKFKMRLWIQNQRRTKLFGTKSNTIPTSETSTVYRLLHAVHRRVQSVIYLEHITLYLSEITQNENKSLDQCRNGHAQHTHLPLWTFLSIDSFHCVFPCIKERPWLYLFHINVRWL